jgi:hypothetical protein
VHDDVTLPGLERVLQDILKGLESCVVPDEWGTPDALPCISSTAISDTVTSTVPSTVPSADPGNREDMAMSHITSTVQPSDRRSSRFEAQVKTKAKTETGTGTGAGAGNEAADGPLMRRLAEDFMYVPTKIPDYRYIMPCLTLSTAHPAMISYDRPCAHLDIRSISSTDPSLSYPNLPCPTYPDLESVIPFIQ